MRMNLFLQTPPASTAPWRGVNPPCVHLEQLTVRRPRRHKRGASEHLEPCVPCRCDEDVTARHARSLLANHLRHVAGGHALWLACSASKMRRSVSLMLSNTFGPFKNAPLRCRPACCRLHGTGTPTAFHGSRSAGAFTAAAHPHRIPRAWGSAAAEH